MFATANSVTPRCFAVFDPDGAGPMGTTLLAGAGYPLPASGLLFWNSTDWGQIGGGFAVFGSYPTIDSLLVFDDDGPGANPPALFAGGYFATAAGVPANGIVKLTPSGWQPLSIGLTTTQYPNVGKGLALTSFDPDSVGPSPPVLIVGGSFSSAGLFQANNIASWNGSSWATLGSGMTGGPSPRVLALTVFDDDGAGPNPSALYAAGAFSTAGGIAASNIARWNGTSWSPVGAGFDGTVTHLVAFDEDGTGPGAPALFAAGTFAASGPSPLNRIARWNGTQWSSPGGGPDADIQTLAVHDEDGAGPLSARLFAGGDFTSFGGVSAAHIAKWDGAAWTSLGAGTDAPVLGLATWDADGAGPTPGPLWVTGMFALAGGLTSCGVARWNGTTWVPNGNSAGGAVERIASFDPDGIGPAPPQLIVAGWIKANTPAGLASNLARLDGGTFLPLGGSMNGSVEALATYDPDGAGPATPQLIAGGGFSTAGTAPANLIAKWDGTSWSPLGGGLSPPTAKVFALEAYDPDGPGPMLPLLVAGGTFTSAGGVPVNGIAIWNGAQWSAMGSGVEIQNGPSLFRGTIRCLKSIDVDGPGSIPPVLIAGGFFNRAGGLQAGSIALWYGGTWYSVGSLYTSPGSYSSNIATVYTVAYYDADGPGSGVPVIVAGGNIDYPPGKLAQWDGAAWTTLAVFGTSTSSGFVRTVEVVTAPGSSVPTLIVGGGFTLSFNGVPEHDLAQINLGVASGVGGFNSMPYSTGGVAAIHEFDRDGSGPIPTELYVGGAFSTAGGISSAYLARIGTPTSIALTLSTAGGPGSITISNASCLPGVNYFTALTFEAMNAIAVPATGPWAGLYVSTGELLLEASTLSPPFFGVLDAGGGSVFSVPAGTLTGLSGMTLFGVTRAFDPATLTPIGNSNVASVIL